MTRVFSNEDSEIAKTIKLNFADFGKHSSHAGGSSKTAMCILTDVHPVESQRQSKIEFADVQRNREDNRRLKLQISVK